ncbi:hypothetical protein EI94DRAFT_1815916 [Lactarius quietus]|nr:hypothetical protein EI94DRAFT_1815916 [Lactarius quietus]
MTKHLNAMLAALAGITSGSLSATKPPDQPEASTSAGPSATVKCRRSRDSVRRAPAQQAGTAASCNTLVTPTPDQSQVEKPLPESALPDFFAYFVRMGVPPPQTEPKPISQPTSEPYALLAN